MTKDQDLAAAGLCAAVHLDRPPTWGADQACIGRNKLRRAVCTAPIYDNDLDLVRRIVTSGGTDRARDVLCFVKRRYDHRDKHKINFFT